MNHHFALPFGSGRKRQGSPAQDSSARSPRQQRRYDRGHQRATQRKEHKKSGSGPAKQAAAQQLAGVEQVAGASSDEIDGAPSVAATASADATIAASPAQEPLHFCSSCSSTRALGRAWC